MDIFSAYTKILTEELKPALGCTEPVAIAYAAAAAAGALGKPFEKLEVRCSGNVVKSVTVPNSGGMKGIEAAALLGALGGKASLHLEVLSAVDDAVRNKVSSL